jgi:hypothetical protein
MIMKVELLEVTARFSEGKNESGSEKEDTPEEKEEERRPPFNCPYWMAPGNISLLQLCITFHPQRYFETDHTHTKWMCIRLE